MLSSWYWIFCMNSSIPHYVESYHHYNISIRRNYVSCTVTAKAGMVNASQINQSKCINTSVFKHQSKFIMLHGRGFYSNNLLKTCSFFNSIIMKAQFTWIRTLFKFMCSVLWITSKYRCIYEEIAIRSTAQNCIPAVLAQLKKSARIHEWIAVISYAGNLFNNILYWWYTQLRHYFYKQNITFEFSLTYVEYWNFMVFNLNTPSLLYSSDITWNLCRQMKKQILYSKPIF